MANVRQDVSRLHLYVQGEEATRQFFQTLVMLSGAEEEMEKLTTSLQKAAG